MIKGIGEDTNEKQKENNKKYHKKETGASFFFFGLFMIKTLDKID